MEKQKVGTKVLVHCNGVHKWGEVIKCYRRKDVIWFDVRLESGIILTKLTYNVGVNYIRNDIGRLAEKEKQATRFRN